MVSFSCESCNETMIKKKVAQHLNRCRAPVTCIDCSKTFPGQTFKDHNQCITEDQKYQGKLYQPKTKSTPKEATKSKEKSATTTASQTDSKPIETSKVVPKQAKPIKVTKEQPLKKVLKTLRKKHNLDKKKILEELTVTKDGQLTLKL